MEAKEEVIEHIDQLSMFVGGSAGTGKSFLINDIRALFALYGKSSWLQVAASTGTAAKGVGGRTIQSLLRIKVRKSKGDFQESELDDKDKDGKVARGTADMRFLIIDEVSMIGCRLAGQINQKLQLAKHNQGPWGGVHIIFFGDFAQFRPCASKPLYSAKAKFHITAKDTFTAQGRELFEKLSAVVFLDEQQRYKGDQQWLQLLERLRANMITDADYNTLLDLVISDLNTNDPKWKHANFVTVRNPLRTALNYEHAQQQAKAAGVPLIVAVA